MAAGRAISVGGLIEGPRIARGGCRVRLPQQENSSRRQASIGEWRPNAAALPFSCGADLFRSPFGSLDQQVFQQERPVSRWQRVHADEAKHGTITILAELAHRQNTARRAQAHMLIFCTALPAGEI